jgi:hypothetical protein
LSKQTGKKQFLNNGPYGGVKNVPKLPMLPLRKNNPTNIL